MPHEKKPSVNIKKVQAAKEKAAKILRDAGVFSSKDFQFATGGRSKKPSKK